MMDLLDRPIPRYMLERANLTRLVIFTALFALLFINLYKPFSSDGWYPVSEFIFFVFSSLIILTGVVVVVISRVLMYFHARRHTITYGQYALWIAGEILFMALFYTIYTLSVSKGERDIWQVFQDSVVNTSLVLLLPYAMLQLYFSRREKERQLHDAGEVRGKEERPPLLSFRDEKGDARLSVLRPNLLYIEAADNYVVIWYLNKGAVTRFLLRNSLKALERELTAHDVLRCHRSYMVNLEHVKVIRRDKEGLFLELGVEKVPDLPVSNTYGDKIAHWFTRYSS
jgi:hypothetical protein